MRKYLILMLLFCGCASAPKAVPPPDPCSAVTANDVFGIFGAAFDEPRKSVQTSGDITVTQCYYGQPVRYAADSMTIEYTTAPDIHELWEKQFEPGEEHEREEERGEKHRIEVEGLGRDAYWGGNRVSGALYVLAPRAIMRISIGGQGDVASKMEKAKKVAMKALEKMP